MCRLAPLLVQLFSCLVPAMKVDKPKGRDYNIEYRVEWGWEKDKPQVDYEWFWMPDGEYLGQ